MTKSPLSAPAVVLLSLCMAGACLAQSPAPEARQPVEKKIERIRVEAEERIKTASAGAMREVWKRLFERVKHVATQTGDPTKPLFASMLENARRDCDLLAKLNFAGDPNLEALRQEVESRLASQNIDALRQDETIRSSTAADAQAILHKVAAFM